MFLSHGPSKWLQNKLPVILFKMRAIYFCLDICTFKLFCCWLKLYSVYVPHFLYLFISWWLPARIPLLSAVSIHEYRWAIAMQHLTHAAEWRVLRRHLCNGTADSSSHLFLILRRCHTDRHSCQTSFHSCNQKVGLWCHGLNLFFSDFLIVTILTGVR